MIILKPGQYVESTLYKFNCEVCGCVFLEKNLRCVRHRVYNVAYGPKGIIYTYHDCPNCGTRCAGTKTGDDEDE